MRFVGIGLHMAWPLLLGHRLHPAWRCINSLLAASNSFGSAFSHLNLGVACALWKSTLDNRALICFRGCLWWSNMGCSRVQHHNLAAQQHPVIPVPDPPCPFPSRESTVPLSCAVRGRIITYLFFFFPSFFLFLLTSPSGDYSDLVPM